MAKKGMIERNNKRIRMNKRLASKREDLKRTIMDKNVSVGDRFRASIKLSSLPRNSSRVRIRNRCQISGRPRGYYRRFALSRIYLRSLASEGMLPGVIKASW